MLTCWRLRHRVFSTRLVPWGGEGLGEGVQAVAVDAGEQVDDLVLGGAVGVEAAGPLDLGGVLLSGGAVDAEGGEVAVDGEGGLEDGVVVAAFGLVEVDEALEDDLALGVGQPADPAAFQGGALGDGGEGRAPKPPIRLQTLSGGAGMMRLTDVQAMVFLQEGCRRWRGSGAAGGQAPSGSGASGLTRSLSRSCVQKAAGIIS